MKEALCICASLPWLHNRTRVTVVMHKLEHRKSTNTGRLAVRCLDNSALVFHDEIAAVDGALRGRRPVVLFPVAGARSIEAFRGEEGLALVVLDANWRQAARMRKRFAAQGIPFARAPAGPSAYALRKGPHDDGMSTLEAVARSLAVLDDLDPAPLMAALEAFQDRLLWLRGLKARGAVAGGIPAGVERHTR